jgi:hypothetical protein
VPPAAAAAPAINGVTVTGAQMLAAPVNPSLPQAAVPAAAGDPSLPAGQAMRARHWVG